MTGDLRRVLLVENDGDIIGGGQISLLALMRHLDRQRYAPLCLCPAEGSMTAAVRQAGIPVRVVEQPQLRLGSGVAIGRAVRNLYRVVRRERIQLIHANGSRCMLYAGLAGKLARVPVVWHVRVTESDGWWDRMLASLAPQIVVNSAAVRERFSWFGDRERIRIIYNGEDLEKHRQVSGKEIRWETRTGEGYLVGMVGRLTEEKDHETYLRAAALIAARLPQTKFLIVGEDPDAGQGRRCGLARLAGELGLSDKVVFTGMRQDIPQIMAGLDILVHCAHGEAFGRVLVEAMAAATPVVATAVGGIPEVVVEGRTGMLVEEGDAEAVGQAAVELLRDPARRQEMGRAGQKRVEDCFSLAAHLEQVQALYDEVLGIGL